MTTKLQKIGQYELQQRLQRNNRGEVWRAYDCQTRQQVLLKIYPANLFDAATLTQYMQDVERVAALHHPNIGRIHDIQVFTPRNPGDPPTLICLAREYIEGETLADYIKKTSAVGKMPTASEVIQIFSPLALALDSARLHGISHGNLKPTNILLHQNTVPTSRIGTPMLTDFGLTRLQGKKYGSEISAYQAPEQVKGAPAESLSDIYALGMLLYELYTGAPAFRGNRPLAVMMQQLNAVPTSPELINPSISPALAQVIMRCLAKDPQERFPTAVSLVVALANALHTPVPESLRRADALTSRSTPVNEPKNATTSTHQPTTSGSSGSGLVPPPPLSATRKRRAQPRSGLIALLAILIILAASAGTWVFLIERANSAQPQNVGQAFFENSGQVNANTTQGINDELQIELAHLPDPASGKRYYAWLLGDISQTEATPLFLGPLTLKDGKVDLLYSGEQQHTNLLSVVSRFLITEDDARNPSSNPILNQGSWRYYAVIPQAPIPTDALHFSMLDHLRHLLVESPELALRNMHGGLAFWFVRDSALVSDLANSLAGNWQHQDTETLHNQLVRILDYLDGSAAVTGDVPAGTPFLADPQIAQIALLGPAPQGTDPPGYVYQDEAPPGYVYLIQNHLNGVVLTPQATSEQHQLATQISQGTDSIKRELTQVYQEAKQLVSMTPDKLLQTSVLTTLNDMAVQAQYAYTGQPDLSTGSTRGGSLWIYNNLQRLATFEVAPYPQA